MPLVSETFFVVYTTELKSPSYEAIEITDSSLVIDSLFWSVVVRDSSSSKVYPIYDLNLSAASVSYSYVGYLSSMRLWLLLKPEIPWCIPSSMGRSS